MFAVKQASWRVLIVYVMITMAVVWWANLLTFSAQPLAQMPLMTGGLIDASLPANLLKALGFGLIVFAWARLRPTDVGLRWDRVREGLLLTVALWLAMQLVSLLINGIKSDIQLDPNWARLGIMGFLGLLTGQMIGSAFLEELSYRAFLLPQLYHKVPLQDGRLRLILAVLVTSALFSLAHIPARMYTSYSPGWLFLDFGALFLLSLVLAAVYLVSRNIFLTVGVHALYRMPMLITQPSIEPAIILFLLTAALLWALRGRLRNRVRLLGPVQPDPLPTDYQLPS